MLFLDFATTYYGVYYRNLSELNPLMTYIVNMPILFFIIKIPIEFCFIYVMVSFMFYLVGNDKSKLKKLNHKIYHFFRFTILWILSSVVFFNIFNLIF
jgi:hypothetical protein